VTRSPVAEDIKWRLLFINDKHVQDTYFQKVKLSAQLCEAIRAGKLGQKPLPAVLTANREWHDDIEIEARGYKSIDLMKDDLSKGIKGRALQMLDFRSAVSC
jgi:hypothetical protein